MTVLIFGITGQDGVLLCKNLLLKGYNIIGTTRNINSSKLNYLYTSKLIEKIKIEEVNTLKFKEVYDIITKFTPNEIYNLSGQSSVSKSFINPYETFQSIVDTSFNILESIRLSNLKIKFFNASSIDCFGNKTGTVTEDSYFDPVSPYGVAKASTNLLVKNYRETYGIFACSGILTNHESYHRDNSYVTIKIITSAINIYKKKLRKISLGNINIERDWGWAEDYVEAMYLMLQKDVPQDFIISTGKTITLIDFLDYTFRKFNLKYQDFLTVDNLFTRKNEIFSSKASPEKALNILGWSAKNNVYNVIDKLVEYYLENENK